MNDLDAILARGEHVWNQFEIHRQGRIHRFVPADGRVVHSALERLRPHADTFLELGSGAGTITVLADRIGYDAYGIEADPYLYSRSLELADQCRSRAVFAHGSYLPVGFRADDLLQVADFVTVVDADPAYGLLGMELCDFDLVYAFPWPGEEALLLELMGRHGSPSALLLTYGATEGCRLYRGGDEVPLPPA